jgi:hypothetical protein
MLIVCLGYLIGGLLFLPFTIGAFNSYSPGAANSSSLMQLGAVILVLVLVPVGLAYSLWKGYRIGWWIAILFAVFNIVLYVITFSSLKVTLSSSPFISNSVVGPLSYAVAYGIVYLGTYIVAIIDILLNISLLYFLTRRRTKGYFGM